MHNMTKFTYKEGYDHVAFDVVYQGIADYGLEGALTRSKEGYMALLEDMSPTEHTRGCIDALKDFLVRHKKLKGTIKHKRI